MKKKIIVFTLVLAIMTGVFAVTAAATTLAANPTASTVYVNGAAKAFEAYNIGGNNYFKLRDLAYVLNGTAKQFEVGYDNDTKAITLTTGRAYTPDGGEMANGDGRAKTASPTASRIYLNGTELNLTVYLIGGNNFFKLRDLMEAIDVFVGYDNATKAITLDTSKGYVPEVSAPTPTTTEPPTTTQPPETTQPPSGDTAIIVGSWGWFEGGYWDGGFGLQNAEVYIFNQDGTFNLYKAALAGSTAYETFFKGKYSISGSQIVFSDVVKITIDVSNGDSNGGFSTVGTRARASKMYTQFPSSGYSSYSMDSEEYKIIDGNTIGIGVSEAYGSDGYYHYEKDWIR